MNKLHNLGSSHQLIRAEMTEKEREQKSQDFIRSVQKTQEDMYRKTNLPLSKYPTQSS